MKELVCLLEEDSAKALLDTLLPRVLDPSIRARTIAFEGKQDMEKQLTQRLRGYVNPNARFLVLRDQDSAPDCKKVKGKLDGLCRAAGKDAFALVRVACRELESMYLADLAAVSVVLDLRELQRHQGLAKFRQPDRLESPSHELKQLTRGKYQKVGSSRQLGVHLDLANERSSSFKNLLGGIRKLQAELLSSPNLHP